MKNRMGEARWRNRFAIVVAGGSSSPAPVDVAAGDATVWGDGVVGAAGPPGAAAGEGAAVVEGASIDMGRP
jgi:hypothetical protein